MPREGAIMFGDPIEINMKDNAPCSDLSCLQG
jgi:hypothetical protein